MSGAGWSFGLVKYDLQFLFGLECASRLKESSPVEAESAIVRHTEQYECSRVKALCEGQTDVN
jgi:hypothetical protein